MSNDQNTNTPAGAAVAVHTFGRLVAAIKVAGVDGLDIDEWRRSELTSEEVPPGAAAGWREGVVRALEKRGETDLP
ncbi:MAG: hypothetical protein EPN61_15340 [Burkholderiaceae bacterium]|nr:MAG: hypothetical protein EPN61_15340 [Burkholderiaceae bacterium]